WPKKLRKSTARRLLSFMMGSLKMFRPPLYKLLLILPLGAAMAGCLPLQSSGLDVSAPNSPGFFSFALAEMAIDAMKNGSGGATTFTIGGTASGLLSGQSVTLQLNGGSDLTVSQDGSFKFSGGLAT